MFHTNLRRNGPVKSNSQSTNTYQFPDSVEDQVHDLLPYGVVSPGVVVGSVLLASDQLLRVKQLAVGACANFV